MVLRTRATVVPNNKMVISMRERRGLSLMEIIVSLVITALVLVGLANLFVATKRHLLHSRTRIVSAELTKSYLEPLRADVRQDQWGSNCLSGGAGCPPANVSINGMNMTVSYQFSNVTGTTLRRVNVLVGWNESKWQ